MPSIEDHFNKGQYQLKCNLLIISSRRRLLILLRSLINDASEINEAEI